MRAVRCSDGAVRVVEAEEPSGVGVRVRIAASGICGTDLALIGAEHPPAVILGHELSGWLDDGTAVAIEALLPCERCEQCVAGAYHLCSGTPSGNSVDICLGLTVLDGGMADVVRVPQRCIVPLPPSVDVRDACLVEPLAVGFHGLRKGGVRAAQRVAVVGAGSIGLCTVAAAQRLGCEVGVVARHARQMEVAEALGATAAHGVYDVTVDAAGSASSIATAMDMVRKGGTVVAVGIHTGPVPVDGAVFAAKELRIVASVGYSTHNGRRDVDDAAELLGAYSAVARLLITHRFPLDEAPRAFATAGDRSSGAVKVVVEP
ncbi:MAG TPA: alcohol dehydrogenase catalytic domain-containing protein [Candidatus Dormibacteraeota bacterium]|jgi:threonine dehydrogenase-like Zn-dependent dehydrogenase|nr:alcohol dehydrogenase catalytic domain-containing protein [Candidatus Dormibacteraeota bacterium]